MDLVSACCSSPLWKYLAPEIFIAKPRSHKQQDRSAFTKMLREFRSRWLTHGFNLSGSRMTRSQSPQSETKTQTSNMCTATHPPFSHLYAGGQAPLLQIRTSCRMWANPTHLFWGSLAGNHLGHMTKPASTPHSFLDSLFQHSLQTKQFLCLITAQIRQMSIKLESESMLPIIVAKY